MPSPPSSPLSSPAVRLLQAWVNAYLHHADALLTMHNSAGVIELDDSGEVIFHNLPAEAEWESALLREQARVLGEYSIDRLPVPQHLRPLFALPPPEGIDALLGRWEDQLWVPGLAELNEREFEALDLEMRGYEVQEIREVMNRHRTNRRGLPLLELATVDAYRSRAKGKLRRLFDVYG